MKNFICFFLIMLNSSFCYASEASIPKELVNQASDTVLGAVELGRMTLMGFQDDQGHSHPGFADSLPHIAEIGLGKTGKGLQDVALGLGHIGTLGDGLSNMSVAIAGPKPERSSVSTSVAYSSASSSSSSSAAASSSASTTLSSYSPEHVIHAPRAMQQSPHRSQHYPFAHATRDSSERISQALDTLSTSLAGSPKPQAQQTSSTWASATAHLREEKIHVPESQSSHRFAPAVPSMSRGEQLPISHAMVQAAQNLKPLELNTHTAIRGAGMGMAIVSANQLGAQCGPYCAAALLCGGLYFMKNAHRVDQDMQMAQNYLSKINKQNAKEIASRTKEAALECGAMVMIKGFKTVNNIDQQMRNIEHPRAKIATAALAASALTVAATSGDSNARTMGAFALAAATSFSIAKPTLVDTTIKNVHEKFKKD